MSTSQKRFYPLFGVFAAGKRVKDCRVSIFLFGLPFRYFFFQFGGMCKFLYASALMNMIYLSALTT
jgi:hypothetical protein